MPLTMRLWIVCLCALLASCQTGLQPRVSLDYTVELGRAEQQIERQEFTAAVSLLESLTHAFPEQPAPWRLLGGIYDLEQRPGQALETFKRGLESVTPSTSGYADLALQTTLLCIHRPELAYDPQLPLQHLSSSDPRRELATAAQEAQQGHDVQALRRIIALLKQPLPKPIISEIYFLAAKIYIRMKEQMYVNESLFHAVNFSTSPVLVLRIERLWTPSP